MKIEEVKQLSSYLHFCFGRDAGRQRDHLNVRLSHRRSISFSFCSLSFSTSAFFLSRLDEVSSLKVNADDSSCLHRINATTALLRCLALIAWSLSRFPTCFHSQGKWIPGGVKNNYITFCADYRERFYRIYIKNFNKSLGSGKRTNHPACTRVGWCIRETCLPQSGFFCQFLWNYEPQKAKTCIIIAKEKRMIKRELAPV